MSIGLIALSLCLFGCSGDKQAPAPEAEGVAGENSGAPEAGAKEAAGEPKEAEEKAEKPGGGDSVESVLQAWCGAQTKGDFEAYSAFYSGDFEGIKRTKKGKETKFDHKAWLKDRKGMFKMPLQVDCQAVQVDGEKDGITSVNFEQYWQSPSYADEGPKRVDFKKVDGKWMITGEEMISSKKWDRKKFKDGTAPPKRAFKTYEEIGAHPMGKMVSKQGHKEYKKCHFVKPKDWGGGDEEKWPQDCAQWASGVYGTFE